MISLFLSAQSAVAQALPAAYFAAPADRNALMQKLADLPCDIRPEDNKAQVLSKIQQYLSSYVPSPSYADDAAAKASVLWALKGAQDGGYGIGAVMFHQQAGLLHGAYNAQLQKERSDLHGEMNLLNEFEQKKKFRRYLKSWAFTGGEAVYDSSLTVISSAEPCPMCFVRLSIAGVATKYVTPGPDDGMTKRIDCLPPFWAGLARENTFEVAQASPVLQQLAHVLFFSYLL
ncbi:MAG: hypothetical protein ACLFQ0_06875 [Cyclobacteriaceae bacterium]